MKRRTAFRASVVVVVSVGLTLSACGADDGAPSFGDGDDAGDDAVANVTAEDGHPSAPNAADATGDAPSLDDAASDTLDASDAPDAATTDADAPDAATTDADDAGADAGDPDDCVGNACQNGAVCVDGQGTYTCDCSGTGYKGAHCETPLTVCDQQNACTSAAYPCTVTVPPAFTCLGQHADWPMPDSTPGAAHTPSYDTSTAGEVLDNVTGLTWQRAVPSTYPGCSYNGGAFCKWSEASAYCEGLSLNGKDDWRLPSLIELESIVDDTKYNPAIDTTTFSASAGAFWTSSPATSGGAWFVSFVDGFANSIGSAQANRARCVRGVSKQAITPTQRYQLDLPNDTVTDVSTGLVWQRTPSTSTYAWANAPSQCAAGFRLPYVKELLTLVDPVRKSPALDPVFPTPISASECFWSATTDAQSASFAWSLCGDFGQSTSYPKTQTNRVRCVK